MYRKIYITGIILLTAILTIGSGCSSKLSTAEMEIRDLKLEIAVLQEEIDMQDKDISNRQSHRGNRFDFGRK